MKDRRGMAKMNIEDMINDRDGDLVDLATYVLSYKATLTLILKRNEKFDHVEGSKNSINSDAIYLLASEELKMINDIANTLRRIASATALIEADGSMETGMTLQ